MLGIRVPPWASLIEPLQLMVTHRRGGVLNLLSHTPRNQVNLDLEEEAVSHAPPWTSWQLHPHQRSSRARSFAPNKEPRALWRMRRNHGHKGNGFGIEFAITGFMRKHSGCAHRLSRQFVFRTIPFVSRVKKTGHWALFANANKSQQNYPNVIENILKASR